MYILVDANSFFCHCEKLFRPDLRNREVVVLSNNDGCVVSATRKAKETLDLKTGQPFFEIKEKCEKMNVEIFSSNFSLYTKISKRLSDILKTFSDNVEVYSIDECFLYFPDLKNINWQTFGQQIKDDVFRKLGMPVSVGIGKTKFLSKICNHIAKKGAGVCYYQSDQVMQPILSKISVSKLWGLGKASTAKLRVYNIKSVWDLKIYNNRKNLKKIISKTGLQIQEELNQINCFELNETPKLRQSILCSRTFSYPVSDIDILKKKLSSFISTASSKLRIEKGKTCKMEIFLIKKTYKGISQLNNYCSGYVRFPEATSNTFELIKKGLSVLDDLYKSGETYKKAGVIFENIVYQNLQLGLFEQQHEKNDQLSEVVDIINTRLGKNLIGSAACLGEKQELYRQDFCSAAFLTNWKELPNAS